MAERKNLRCAIYTRKSSEEGLEQSFNSLDAQREACLAYIQSQKHEGWKPIPTTYDDGGFSGGNLQRPAMTRLLEDIASGKVDLVVVYKVDRLTRSLSDFARLVEAFDRKGVSFVSVTQSFNTSTSMGRLTLNVLLSFAQFEREVTGERIRDKIAASKRKGMWMGGTVPMGYDLKDRKLVVNEQEAGLVRWIFRRYLELRSVRALKVDLDQKGIPTKVRCSVSGKVSGGLPWARGALYELLRNPLYLGQIKHRENVYHGEHQPIVPTELWTEVQRVLTDQAAHQGRAEGAAHPSLLVGCVVDGEGRAMVPSHTARRNRRYRYYVSSPGDQGSKSALRVPAHDLEAAVWRRIKAFLESPTDLMEGLTGLSMDPSRTLRDAQQFLVAWKGWSASAQRQWLRNTLQQVRVSPDRLWIQLKVAEVLKTVGESSPDLQASGPITLEADVCFKRGGQGLRFIIPGPEAAGIRQDRPLVQALARGRVWCDQLLSGAVGSRGEISKAQGCSAPHIARHIPLAWLAPDIVEAVLDGRQPAGLSVKRLMEKLPLDWAEQRRVLGFPLA